MSQNLTGGIQMHDLQESGIASQQLLQRGRLLFSQFVTTEQIQQQQHFLFPRQESPDGRGGPPRRLLLAALPAHQLGVSDQVRDPQHARQQHDRPVPARPASA